MNYFAHALPFLDDPYVAAATGVPDWLTVADRGVRIRRKRVQPFLEDPDPLTRSIARGVLQHIGDDLRFHGSPAFAELWFQLTAAIRDALGGESGLRPGFLGHLLVEVLLDASLAAENPDRLGAYYQALASVDPHRIEHVVNRMTSRPTRRLRPMITEFTSRRILWDYMEDAKLWARLNQVMRRVELAALPDDLRQLLPETRRAVDARRDRLLDGIPTLPQNKR